MTVADLAEHLSQTPDEKTRWKTFWEFLEEYRWEPQDIQTALLRLRSVTNAGTPCWRLWPSTSQRNMISPRQAGLS
jgi:hypothetical protein